MNKLVPSLLCLLFLLGSALAVSAQARKAVRWWTFTSAEGDFKVSLPGLLEESPTDDEGPLGKGKTYRFGKVTADIYFSVSYADFPAGIPAVNDERRHAVYDVLRNKIRNKPGIAAITSEGDYQSGELIGRDIQVEMTNGVGGRYRLWFIGQRVYRLFVTYDNARRKDPVLQAKINRLFNSFQTIK